MVKNVGQHTEGMELEDLDNSSNTGDTNVGQHGGGTSLEDLDKSGEGESTNVGQHNEGIELEDIDESDTSGNDTNVGQYSTNTESEEMVNASYWGGVSRDWAISPIPVDDGINPVDESSKTYASRAKSDADRAEEAADSIGESAHSHDNKDILDATTASFTTQKEADLNSNTVKLGTIESGAEANQSDAEIKLQYEANPDTNAFTDSDKVKLDNLSTFDPTSDQTITGNWNWSNDLLVDGGYYLRVDKIDSNPAGGTVTIRDRYFFGQNDLRMTRTLNMAGSAITAVGNLDRPASYNGDKPSIGKTYEFGEIHSDTFHGLGDTLTYTNTDSNLQATTYKGALDELATRTGDVGDGHTHSNKDILDNTTASYTTSEKTKLSGIEVGAEVNPTDAEIKIAYENNTDTNAYTDSEKTKLGTIESGAKDDQNANEVPYTGTLDATNVQDGLNELDAKVDTKVLWRQQWIPGVYYANHMVRDGEWTMMANKETTDRAAPVRIDDPFWVSGFDNLPPWPDAGNFNTTSIYSGQRYTWPEAAGYIDGLRVWFSDVSGATDYTVLVVFNPTDEFPIIRSYLEDFVPALTGWATIPIDPILVIDNTQIDIVLIQTPTQESATLTSDWSYLQNNGNPNTGEARHHSNGRDLRIHYTDGLGASKEAEIRQLKAGSTIDVGEIKWDVLDITFEATFALIEVSPQVRINDGPYTFEFTTPTAEPIHCVIDNDHYVSNPNVQGLFSQTGYDPVYVMYNNYIRPLAVLVPDNHAYGVDVLLQEAYISPDWDLVATSAGLGNGALEGDVTTAELVIYDNATSGLPVGNVQDAIDNLAVDKHNHTNKSVLDNTTASYTTAEENKLSNIENNANNYVLPSDVVQDATYVKTDNNYSNADKTKLDGLAEGGDGHTHTNKNVLDAVGSNTIVDTGGGTWSGNHSWSGGHTFNGNNIFNGDNTYTGFHTWTFSDTTEDVSKTGLIIDHNMTGSTPHTADRFSRSIFIDADDNSTGGDSNNEHRYEGLYISYDSNSSTTDDVKGVYTIMDNNNTSAEMFYLTGMFGSVRPYNSGDARTVYSFGTRGVVHDYSTYTGTSIQYMYGLHGKTTRDATATASDSRYYGVYGEVEWEANTIPYTEPAYGVYSVFDNNATGTVTNGICYLFYGGVEGDLPSSNNNYGVYINADVPNKFVGTVNAKSYTDASGAMVSQSGGTWAGEHTWSGIHYFQTTPQFTNNDIRILGSSPRITWDESDGDGNLWQALVNGSNWTVRKANSTRLRVTNTSVSSLGSATLQDNGNNVIHVGGGTWAGDHTFSGTTAFYIPYESSYVSPSTSNYLHFGRGSSSNVPTIHDSGWLHLPAGDNNQGKFMTIFGNVPLNVPDTTSRLYYQATDSAITGSLFTVASLEQEANFTGGLKVNDNSAFHDAYHPNADKWTTGRTITLTGDVTGTSGSWDGSSNLSFATTVGNDSHTHAFNNLTGKASGTGDYKTTGRLYGWEVIAGDTSGSVALTVNDGYGNANLTFNHVDGIPDQDGSAARIEVNTDATSNASMAFELKSNVTSGVAVQTTNVMTIYENYLLLLDGKDLRIGTGNDFRLRHASSENYIDLYTGDLRVRDNTTTRFTFERTTGNFTVTGNINDSSGEVVNQGGGTWSGNHTWSGTTNFTGTVQENGTALSSKYASINHNHDGVYAPASHTHSYDNYGQWNIAANGTSGTSAITSGNTVTFSGTGATTVTRSGDNITINSTDTNTVYTHPTFNGDDFSIDTGALTGAAVISDLDINITTNSEGHVTDANATVATRNLTAANIGAATSGHNHSGVYEPVFSKNTAFNKNFGTAAGTVCQGNDSRLSDARTPTSHSHSEYLGVSAKAADSELLDGRNGADYVQAHLANGYEGLGINGDTTEWIRTTSKGIIPYQTGGASALGTVSWPFTSIYGTTLYEGGTALSSKYLGISAKAADADKLDGINSSSFVRSDANDVKTAGYLRFNDNIELEFGTGHDVELFCNGTHMYMDLNSGIGNFYIRDGTTTRFTFDDAGHFTATGDIRTAAVPNADSDLCNKKYVDGLLGETRTLIWNGTPGWCNQIGDITLTQSWYNFKRLEFYLGDDYDWVSICTIGVEALKELINERTNKRVLLDFGSDSWAGLDGANTTSTKFKFYDSRHGWLTKIYGVN